MLLERGSWLALTALLCATLLVAPADAQQRGAPGRAGPAIAPGGHQSEAIDLNEGKTAAEMFQSGCAICHRTAAGLGGGRRESEIRSFLRQHYTTGMQQAGMLAAFLAESGRPAPAASVPARPGPVERPPAAVGGRKPPQEASRPEREPAAKRRPPAKPEHPAAAAAPPPTDSEPAAHDPEPAAVEEPATATSEPPPEEKPATPPPPEIPL